MVSVCLKLLDRMLEWLPFPYPYALAPSLIRESLTFHLVGFIELFTVCRFYSAELFRPV